MRPDPVPVHVAARSQQRDARLKRFGFPSYSAYLASSTWSGVKQQYRNSGRPMQCPCGSTERLEMHHLTYERVGGDELPDDLQPLCRDCHRIAHVLERRRDLGLDLVGLYDLEAGQRNLAERLRRELAIHREKFQPILDASEQLDRAVGAVELASRDNRDFKRTARSLRHQADSLRRKIDFFLDDPDSAAGDQ